MSSSRSGLASWISTPRIPRPRGSSPIAACVSASMPVTTNRSRPLAARVDHAERGVAGAGQLGCGLDDPLEDGVERQLGRECDTRVDDRSNPVRLGHVGAIICTFGVLPAPIQPSVRRPLRSARSSLGRPARAAPGPMQDSRDTLPMSALEIAPWPCDPTTIRSAPISSASSTIFLAGSPTPAACSQHVRGSLLGESNRPHGEAPCRARRACAPP